MATVWHDYVYDFAVINRQSVVVQRGGYVEEGSTPPWRPYATLVDPDSFELRRVTEALNWVASARAQGRDHTVIIDADLNWQMEHPLLERLEGSLFDCSLHKIISERGHGHSAGTYRVSPKRGNDGAGWEWDWSDA